MAFPPIRRLIRVPVAIHQFNQAEVELRANREENELDHLFRTNGLNVLH
jgi:hypothetical protein